MTPSILTAAQEGLRLAEKATKGPWVELPEPYAAGIKSSRGTLICALGPTATKDEFLANRDLIAHCGTHHADICRALIQLQAENAELKHQLEETVDERPLCETAHILLKANHTYRFIVAEGCADCARMAHEAATGPEELAAIDTAIRLSNLNERAKVLIEVLP